MLNLSAFSTALYDACLAVRSSVIFFLPASHQFSFISLSVPFHSILGKPYVAGMTYSSTCVDGEMPLPISLSYDSMQNLNMFGNGFGSCMDSPALKGVVI